MLAATADPSAGALVAIPLGALAAVVVVALHATAHEGAHWLAARLLFGGRVKPRITLLPSLRNPTGPGQVELEWLTDPRGRGDVLRFALTVLAGQMVSVLALTAAFLLSLPLWALSSPNFGQLFVVGLLFMFMADAVCRQLGDVRHGDWAIIVGCVRDLRRAPRSAHPS